MSDEIAKRVAARFCAAQDEDGPHDPSNGVLHDWQYEALADKGAWKGYRYSVAVWSWDTTNEDQDEPDDWGDNTMRGASADDGRGTRSRQKDPLFLER